MQHSAHHEFPMDFEQHEWPRKIYCIPYDPNLIISRMIHKLIIYRMIRKFITSRMIQKSKLYRKNPSITIHKILCIPYDLEIQSFLASSKSNYTFKNTPRLEINLKSTSISSPFIDYSKSGTTVYFLPNCTLTPV